MFEGSIKSVFKLCDIDNFGPTRTTIIKFVVVST